MNPMAHFKVWELRGVRYLIQTFMGSGFAETLKRLPNERSLDHD